MDRGIPHYMDVAMFVNAVAGELLASHSCLGFNAQDLAAIVYRFHHIDGNSLKNQITVGHIN